MPNEPVPGLYERLLTQELRRLLRALDPSQVDYESPDAADSHVAVADHLRSVLERVLRSLPEEDRPIHQAELCNSLLGWLQRDVADRSEADGDALVLPPSVLREVRSKAPGLGNARQTPRPQVPLSSADLLVNARGEPPVGLALEREIHSADRIDLLCAFVRWNGLRVMRPALESHRLAGRPLRVITTVYTGSTERRALDWLCSIGAEVKVSYDTRTTRLHAKAWLFERASGYSTAYIGSSNLTHSAMLDGVEWNVRLAQASTPDLIDKFTATFDSYWSDPDFESYDPTRDAERFDSAVQATPGTEPSLAFHFDLQPWPFQREMLQRLEVERERHHRHRNLVVAATGTGKTLVAAFDYRQLRARFTNPSLLFVAHRREILSQSLNAYRAVLRQGDFGELLVDGHKPEQGRHVFASIQSLAATDIDAIQPEAFDIVVVDEFHRAAAPTYTRLLSRLRPKILLGLTATPERSDSKSVLDWFDGRIAVELRLWDALERGLLSPFQYFGVHDGTDLRGVQWSRGGYDVRGLENLYTGDQARTSFVMQAIQDKVADPSGMRALGFCVSVAHARFMAAEFSRRGLPAVAVSGETPTNERDRALRDLRERRINVVFCVDVFNEGIDVPEIDTVLFLRPTESALVFLQQFGRGLRRAPDKPCLTVLDFVGGAHRSFRFDLRFRALLRGHRAEIIRQIEQGFPTLPSGCTIQLDRVAADIVLQNIRGSIGSTFESLVVELRSMADSTRHSGGDPEQIGLATFLKNAALGLDDLYKSPGWSWARLRREAGLSSLPEGPDEPRLSKAIPRLLHVDDPWRLEMYKRAVTGDLTPEELDDQGYVGRTLQGLHFLLWGADSGISSVRTSIDRLRQNPAVSAEMGELFSVLDDQATHAPEPLDKHAKWIHRIPLAVHSRASLDEILTAFGRMSFIRPHRIRQGVDFDPATQSDLFFVTLEKIEGHYSPTTMYRDYAISPDLFHWESQSTTSLQSPTGQRYLQQRAAGTNAFLFVRHRKHIGNRTAAYTVLGAAEYQSHQGSRPIAITWRLRKPMPDDLFRETKVAAG